MFLNKRVQAMTISLPSLRLLGSAVVAFSLSACFASYDNLSPEQQVKYYGTQPGYHSLSDYFAVDVAKGLMRFYYLGRSGHDKVLLGTVLAFAFDASNWGPRDTAFGISDDGQRLLFFDEPGVVQYKSGRLRADLYLFDTTAEHKTLIRHEILRYSTSCIDVPRNAVRFGVERPASGSSDEFAYSTEGKETPLAGVSCGPL